MKIIELITQSTDLRSTKLRRKASAGRRTGGEGDLRERIKAEGSITASGALVCLTTVGHSRSVAETMTKKEEFEGPPLCN